MIRPWVFEFFPELNNEGGGAAAPAAGDYCRRYLDLWKRDEELGFEGIFFSEHHFGGSFSPSPNLLIAATAARTSRIRLGVMALVVPYYTPARIVEEIGMLDHISGGRLEIGTGIGVPQELARLNIGMDEARALSAEAVEIIDAALSAGVVSHQGKYFNYDKLRLLPRPIQVPHPPKWTTIVSVDSARKSARRGSKVCTGFNPTGQIKALFDAYRAEAASCGLQVGADHLALRRRVVVAQSDSQARELSHAVRERYKEFVSHDPRVKLTPTPDAPGQQGDFTVSDDEFIAGTPEHVAETIVDQCRRTGAGHFLAVLHWGAGLDEVVAAHELFGREVVPVLRQADV
ncbi:MAG: LLM class flavin-dependent oxidoreductase [Xanthobacteraceae bacterium]|nr:LLM class flavin-dependent oxidoreductase [Xanthobacteraceae bacterium]